MHNFTQIKPGNFSIQAAADVKRYEFDMRNETILANRFTIDFLFIGDSIFNNWEIAPYFAKHGYMAINRSVGGDTPYYIAKRFEADVLQLKPKYVVVKCGINETWILEDSAHQSKLAQTADLCYQRIMEPLQDILTRCAACGQKLFMCSVLPVYGADSPSVAMRKELILRVNESLRLACANSIAATAIPIPTAAVIASAATVSTAASAATAVAASAATTTAAAAATAAATAAPNNAVFVDFHQALTDADRRTLCREYSDDGCHPNVYGYNKMAEIFLGVLAEEGLL